MRTAILGATGLVGRTMLACLAERPWADSPPLLLASARSTGQKLDFCGQELACQDASLADFRGVDLALFSAGAEASRQFAPRAREAGAWVVDNSSAFRLDPAVPLVVPEINPGLVPAICRDAAGSGGIIANPNCSTIQIALALAPLQQAFGLQAVHVTTMQSVSGAGQKGSDELAAASARYAAGETFQPQVFARTIAGNVVPEIGPALPDGSFEEENKVVQELRKILDLPDLAVTCTATRVPVLRGHSAALRVVLSGDASPEVAADAMQAWPGLEVASGPHAYRTPHEIAGQTLTHVGRLRGEPGRRDVLLCWVVADNLLKGAATNAVQIADLLVGAGD
jgi:aspartate-semialdehyde dehydrogenase